MWWATITPLGIVYIVLTMVVLLAGVNTGNNMLYILGGGLLGTLLYSGIAGLHNLISLKVERIQGDDFFAGEEGTLYVTLTNSSRWRALGGILLWGHDLPTLPRQQTLRVPVPYTFPSRGLHPFPLLVFTSSYPFGLFQRKKEVLYPGDILVYPSPKSCSMEDVQWAGLERFPTPMKPSFYGEKEWVGMESYQPGDDLRHVDWKKTAQMGEPMVRRYRYYQEKGRFLLLPPHTDEAYISHGTYWLLRSYEEAIPFGLVHNDQCYGPYTSLPELHTCLGILAQL